MSILNVNKINPVGGGSTITIAGIASVTNNISVGNSVTAGSFVGPIEGAVTGNVTGNVTGTSSGLSGNPSINTTGIVTATSFVGSTPLSHRNVIINGAAMVAQRGDTTSGATTGGYATDRFQAVQNESGTITISQDSDAPSGFRKCHRLTQTTAQGSLAANDLTTFRYNAEGYDVQRFKKGTSDAEQFTVSFWVKSVDQSSYPVTYILELRDPVNTRSCCKAYTVTASNTWEYKTITFPADTTGQWATDNSKSLEMNWFVCAGSNYTTGTLSTTWAGTVTANRAAGLTANLSANTANRFFLTGVQLEVGPVATPFEHRSFGEELTRCSRYLQIFHVPTNNSRRASNITATVHGAGNGVYLNIAFTHPMRAAPSLTVDGAFGGNVFTGSWSGDTLSNYSSEYYTDALSTLGFHGITSATISSSRTTGLTGQIYTANNGSNDAALIYSAEL